MSTNVVNPPFPRFDGLDGQPLENGMVWIGVANMDAPSNPIAVFWDAALTIAATQPIRTVNGYLSRDGSPGVLFAGSDYSIKVTTSAGVPVYSAPARVDVTVTDVVISSGESLIVESGGTIDVEDGAVVNVGNGTGVGVQMAFATNARIVGNIVPDAAGSQELGSSTRDWFAHLSGARVTGDILSDTAGSMTVGLDTFPAEEMVSRSVRTNALTTYRTAQPSSSSDYAGLAKLNARGTLLAACRQLGCNSAGYPDGTATLMQAASATSDGPYNVASITESSDAQGIKFTVTFTVPLPRDVKFSITPEYRNGGLLDVAIGPVTPMVVGPLTGVSAINSVDVRLFLATGSTITSVRHPFSLLAYGTPSATGATGIVSPIA